MALLSVKDKSFLPAKRRLEKVVMQESTVAVFRFLSDEQKQQQGALYVVGSEHAPSFPWRIACIVCAARSPTEKLRHSQLGSHLKRRTALQKRRGSWEAEAAKNRSGGFANKGIWSGGTDLVRCTDPSLLSSMAEWRSRGMGAPKKRWRRESAFDEQESSLADAVCVLRTSGGL